MRRRLVLAVGMSLLLVAALMPAAASAAGPERFGRVEGHEVDPKLARELRKLRDPDRQVMVFVELTRPSVADAIAGRLDAGEEISAARRAELRGPLAEQQGTVKREIQRLNGRVHATFTDVANGFRATMPMRNVERLSRFNGVKMVYPVSKMVPTNDNSARYVKAPQTWSQAGYTGNGVKIAVIDTGINYYHKTFSGAGQAANDTDNPNIVEPGTFPTAKVIGGWDFVGDLYDADTVPNPTPDPDPRDCNGHGTHVAGTAAGFGVKSDGSTYTGPYNPTALNSTSWNVPPGMAPRALLLAYKVFGCDGGTYVVLDAIEMAVRDGAHVINMSLGLDYGNGGRIEEIATNNAVRAGVVVVASAGNSGPSAYINGSPGTAEGAISVAAMDADPSFPSVWIDMPTGPDIRAINANGDTDDLPVTGTMNHFEDNSLTPDDESLGCTVADWTYNNFLPGQIAVTHRGVCARVDRAIIGDDLGASAVIMINTSAAYPPYEGPIEGVDIPFLGVPSTDHVRFHADDGGSATIREAPALANPGYKWNATFSSGGFRRYDQLLKPDVIAPGVSVISADTDNMTGGVGISGTSMASPAVAGVAALVRQARPKLHPRQIKSLIVNTATTNNINPKDLRIVGNGAVDALRATRSVAHVTTPNPRDGTQQSFIPSLTFGLEEIVKTSTDPALSRTRSFRVWNRSNRSITYNITNRFATASRGMTVSIAPSQVTVPANSNRLVRVTIKLTNAKARALPDAAPGHGPALDVDHFGQLHMPLDYIGGRLLLKPTVTRTGVMTLRVPWAVVPRGTSNVWGQLGSWSGGDTATSRILVRNSSVHTGISDVFAWGLQDPREGYDGMDMRAVGFQSLPSFICDSSVPEDDVCLVAAINNWSRFSNASENLWVLLLDTTGDQQIDYEIYVVDAGLLLGALDGIPISAVFDVAANEFTWVYLATAAPNSSTILVPFLASDVGLEEGGDQDFWYEAESYDLFDDDGDPAVPVFHFDVARTGNNPSAGSQRALYDAFDHPISQGNFNVVTPGAWVYVPVSVDRTRWNPRFGQKGWMNVSLDDLAGDRQADLILTGPLQPYALP
ncbi:hypothetical protein BH23CHL7_BH23CHL7_09840 [soil metagenome]